MANRWQVTLNMPRDRDRAVAWATSVPLGWRVIFMEPQRSTEQNNLMWDALTDIATQLKDWPGGPYKPEDWKDYFMHALKREARWMPSEDGGMIPIGMSTSALGKADMADLLTLIDAFGARNGVKFGKLGKGEA